MKYILSDPHDKVIGRKALVTAMTLGPKPSEKCHS